MSSFDFVCFCSEVKQKNKQTPKKTNKKSVSAPAHLCHNEISVKGLNPGVILKVG